MKLKIKKITYAKHLNGLDLCINGIRYFNRKFPNGMIVNRKNIMSLKPEYFSYWILKYDKKMYCHWVAKSTNVENWCKKDLKIFCDNYLPKIK